MPAESAENCVFSLLADARLTVPFSPPPGIDTDLCQYNHLPLLGILLTALRPGDAVFIDSSPSVITYAEQIIASSDLGTRIQKIRPGEQLRLSPSSGAIGFVHCDLASAGPEARTEILNNHGLQLTSDAVLVIHGTETEMGGALWQTLSAGTPHCLFPQGAGLGLIIPGKIPRSLAPLLGTDEQKLCPEAQARLRSRLSLLGSHWSNLARLRSDDIRHEEQKAADRETRLTLSETRFALAAQQERATACLSRQKQDAKQRQQEISDELNTARQRLADAQSCILDMRSYIAATQTYIADMTDWADRLTEQVSHKNAETSQLRDHLASQAEALDALRTLPEDRKGLFKRLSGALRHPYFVPSVPQTPDAPSLLAIMPRPLPPQLPPAGPDTIPEQPLLPVPLPCSPLRRNVLFISGEPGTPGAIYRCVRNAAACSAAGHHTRIVECAHVTPDDLTWADIVILWRVAFSGHVSILIRLAKEGGAVLLFDLDDLMFIPSLAVTRVIDGIRTTGTTEESVATLYTAMRETMDRCDGCIATTEFLARQMRRFRSLTFTLPNIFDAATLRCSRLAVRIRHAGEPDGLIRIGYAAGTRTHQQDFAVVADVLAKLLAARPELRLCLFRTADSQHPLLLTDEFPCLVPVMTQIEWIDTVPPEDLYEALVRFDISIAPLQPDNAYCEAKSEIKFLEAALAGVPSVVSPTEPYRNCIVDGVTGFLAATQEDWERHLAALIDSPPLRARMARDALNTVLWNFSPERQAMMMETALASLGSESATARATETWLGRGTYQSRGLPEIPDNRVLFEHDTCRQSEVTVIITSHNYETLIVEALESVRSQTIANLDLIVVDDVSTDQSVTTILDWASRHAGRFNRLLVLASCENAGLGGARNIAVSASETPWFLSLDADNRLLPDACEALLATADPLTAYVYPCLREFGGSSARDVVGTLPARPLQLVSGNYIDAMALVARWAWSAAGGYYVGRDIMGWEDYDLWCTLAEMGLRSTHLPEIVAEYRVHEQSMTNSVTERSEHRARVVAFVTERHPWLDLHREAQQRV